jgi:hypothetical protein
MLRIKAIAATKVDTRPGGATVGHRFSHVETHFRRAHSGRIPLEEPRRSVFARVGGLDADQ